MCGNELVQLFQYLVYSSKNNGSKLHLCGSAS